MAYGRIWTEEEKTYLREVAEGRTAKEITKLMNDRFSNPFKESQIVSAKNRYNIKSNIDTLFKKGSKPWNTGTKGLIKPNSGQFKKGSLNGHARDTVKSVGTEVEDIYGVIQVKVSDKGNRSRKWRVKHHLIYEKHHNIKLEIGQKIIFLDGNKRNFDIDNLQLLSNSEMLILNKNNLMYEDAELTRTGVNIAKVISKVSKLKNK